MHGVTTALVGFVFASMIWPHLVKNKVQFYAGFLTILFIIILDGIAHGFGGEKVIYSINALLQAAAIVLFVVSTGLSAKDLGGEVLNTIEVVRRGGEKETIIVPLRGEQPKQRARGDVSTPRQTIDRDIAAEEAELDAAEKAPVAGAPASTPPAQAKDSSSIPME